jgi:hypothetical protein
MAWNTPPKAEDILGMSKEDLKTKLESAASKDDVRAATDGVTEVKSTLASIQESLKALTTPKPPEKPPEGNDDDPTVRVLTDPAKFIADSTKDIRDSSLKTQAQIQEMRARQDPGFSGVFAKYGKELTEAATKFPISSQAQDNFWAYHIRAFLGDKMVKGELRDGNFPSLLGQTSTAVRADGTTDDPDHGLNPEVAAFLRARNVPSEKAARINQLMHVDGEPITHANYFGKSKVA